MDEPLLQQIEQACANPTFRQAGDPILHRRAKPILIEDIAHPAIQQLIDFMRETLRDKGVGLAAPQIGVDARLYVVEVRQDNLEARMTPTERERRGAHAIPFGVFIDPILELSADRSRDILDFEGCLSVPGYKALVPRQASTTVFALDRDGRRERYFCQRWEARIHQHEYEHLQGQLYTAQMYGASFMSIPNHEAYWQDISANTALYRLQPEAA